MSLCLFQVLFKDEIWNVLEIKIRETVRWYKLQRTVKIGDVERVGTVLAKAEDCINLNEGGEAA